MREIVSIMMFLIFMVTAYSQETADALYKSAQERFLSDDFKGALELCNQAIAVNDKFSDTYFLRGKCKYQLQDYKSAIIDYNSAIELNSHNPDYYFQRGNAKNKANDYYGAIEDYDLSMKVEPVVKISDKPDYNSILEVYNQAVSQFPDDPKTYSTRGILKITLGDYDGAIADFNKAIELQPNYDRAYFGLGNVKYLKGDVAGAVADYNKAVEINASRALSYGDVPDYSKLMDFYNKMVEVSAGDPKPYLMRGLARLKLKDYNGALMDYIYLAEIDPGNPDILNKLGEIR
ncbi:MAG: tetratricopeptide repeat protein [Bacteroidia bacterium]|nr:tetratricopeptide repeat protein [Bacteroidia bacterium]